MQERFNKDLEEIKESQYIMNNAINEIKNTLEGSNSRITEAEYRRNACAYLRWRFSRFGIRDGTAQDVLPLDADGLCCC